MGQAKKRQRLTARLLAQHPTCCFCGGSTPATTADHVPAKVVFWGKQRPSGLEMPACQPCNSGTRKLEQLVGVFSRMRVERLTPWEAFEVHELAKSVDRSFPGWRRELLPSSRQEAATRSKFGAHADNIRTVNMAGPLVQGALSAVIGKLGFALHYHHSGHIVPPKGVVQVRFETNASMVDRPFPEEVLNMLGSVEHLRQGSWTSEFQFAYRGAWMDDGQGSIFLGHIGLSIGFIITIFADEAMDTSGNMGFRVYRPGDLKRADADAATAYAVPLPSGTVER